MPIRVAFLTNKSARVSMPILDELANNPDVELVHTFFYDTVSESVRSPLRVITQFGPLWLSGKVLGLLVSIARIRLGRWSRGRWAYPKSSYEFATIRDLQHSTISDINHAETVELLRNLQVDVLLVCVCKNILRGKLLASNDLSFVNIHPSLLPKYRGPMPTFWMLYHGERETGVTFHRMTTRIDEGTILAQRSLPLDPRKSEFQIEQEVFRFAATIVASVLRDMRTNSLPSLLQTDPDAASYFTYPTPKERREMRHRVAHVS